MRRKKKPPEEGSALLMCISYEEKQSPVLLYMCVVHLSTKEENPSLQSQSKQGEP